MEIEQSTVRISQSTKIVTSTPRECPGKSELPPTPDGPKTKRNIFVHVDDGLLFKPKNEVPKLVELLSKKVLMWITRRMKKTGDKIYFLGRVIERTARGYSVEANPKYIRNVMDVLGLEEAKPVMTPSVKRTPTTESLVELEGERRAMYRTVVGKLLYMCQERADVMYSVNEKARKITCPTEIDEMNLERIVRYLKRAASARSQEANCLHV